MSKVTRTFTRDELEELDVPWGNAVVHTEQVDSQRWSTDWIAVFRTEDGLLWEVGYQKPATERQECDRWYDEDPISATQVERRTVEVVKYVPVEAPAEPVTA